MAHKSFPSVYIAALAVTAFVSFSSTVVQCHEEQQQDLSHQITLVGTTHDYSDEERAKRELSEILGSITGDKIVVDSIPRFNLDNGPKLGAKIHSESVPNSKECPREQVESMIKKLMEGDDQSQYSLSRAVKMAFGGQFVPPKALVVDWLGVCSQLGKRDQIPLSINDIERTDEGLDEDKDEDDDDDSSNTGEAYVESVRRIMEKISSVNETDSSSLGENVPPIAATITQTTLASEPELSTELSTESVGVKTESSTTSTFSFGSDLFGKDSLFEVTVSPFTTTTTDKPLEAEDEKPLSKGSEEAAQTDSSTLAENLDSIAATTTKATLTSEPELSQESVTTKTESTTSTFSFGSDLFGKESLFEVTVSPFTTTTTTTTSDTPLIVEDEKLPSGTEEAALRLDSSNYGKFVGVVLGFVLVASYIFCSRSLTKQGSYEVHAEA